MTPTSSICAASKTRRFGVFLPFLKTIRVPLGVTVISSA